MSSTFYRKRDLDSATGSNPGNKADHHQGKRPRLDKSFTSGFGSVPDTGISQGSLGTENQVHDALKLKDGQFGGGGSSPLPYSEAIRCPEPQAPQPRNLSPDPVQHVSPQCHGSHGQVLQGTRGNIADNICFGMH
ncbi:hypothetical protein AnigIFM59636_009273 [Aspergillus niger]|nr:hypothetical protein AnigIFM59636_009273 [Aspergillus niger]